MLNNVYQVAALSTSGGSDNSDPVIGDCMRRLSAASRYDSIPILHGNQMPKVPSTGIDSWAEFRNMPTGIPILQDGTIRPVVFFVPKFLTSKKITDEDYGFLFNKEGREEKEASVNGVKIETQNKKCFNGFIHVMEEVVYLLPNMAEYLGSARDKAIIYSSILDRFSVPVLSLSYTDEVNQLISQGQLKDPALLAAIDAQDSVFIKRYYSNMNQDYSSQERPFATIPNTGGKSFGLPHELLKFDPGWNQYFTPSAASGDGNTALMQRNMSVMLVPKDSTIADWWLKGSGASLRERYGKQAYKQYGANIESWPGDDTTRYKMIADDMDSIDIKVIVKLLNNNMLSSMVGSVPSKFASVLNDANDPMFEHPDEAIKSVESVVMCCNGAIYFTNMMYPPTAYKSVSYPTLVNEKLEIINTAIENKSMAFSAYLNSMSVPCYSFFAPVVRDEAGVMNNKLMWVDPVSFPMTMSGGKMQAILFSFDKDLKKVKADWYAYDYETGTISGNSLKTLTYTAPATTNETMDDDTKLIMNRLSDLLNYHIIIGDIEAEGDKNMTDWHEYRYFPTKGRGTVRFKIPFDPKEFDNANDAQMENLLSQLEVDGGWQIENGEKIKILQRFNFARGTSTNGNGRTYLIDKPLQTSVKSVYDILSDAETYPEFSKFFDLMSTASGRTVDIKDPNNSKKNLYNKDGKPMFAVSSNNHAIGAQMCVSTLNSYHYTIYVPTNDVIDTLIAHHVIYPEATLKQIQKSLDSLKVAIQTEYGKNNQAKADSVFRDSLILFHKQLRGVPATAETTHADSVFDHTMFVEAMRERLKNFVKYHIQDNSVYANAEFKAGMIDENTPATEASYETAFMDRDGQFTKLTVSGGKNITIKDEMGNERHVVKAYSTEGDDPSNAPLWNIMCREYEYSASSVATASAVSSTSLETSSYVVIHQIDGALMHDSFMEEL